MTARFLKAAKSTYSTSTMVTYSPKLASLPVQPGSGFTHQASQKCKNWRTLHHFGDDLHVSSKSWPKRIGNPPSLSAEIWRLPSFQKKIPGATCWCKFRYLALVLSLETCIYLRWLWVATLLAGLWESSHWHLLHLHPFLPLSGTSLKAQESSSA